VGTRTYISRRTPKPAIELDGVRFELAGVSLLDMRDWLTLKDLRLNTVEGIDALNSLFGRVLRDYETFRAHCAEHMTEPDTLVQILADAFNDAFGEDEPTDPTQRPTESSDGPSTTGATSPAVSQSLEVLDVLADQALARAEAMTPEEEIALRAAVQRATQLLPPSPSPG
jgi:hypothetical protein